MADINHLRRLKRDLLDNGKLIESGWIELRIVAVPLDASPVQLQSMREAFFAGAQHLYSSIMTVLDSDAGPTDDDVKRLDLIGDELDAFIKDFQLRRLPTEGSA